MESSREEKQEATMTWPCISMEKQIAVFICDPSHFIQKKTRLTMRFKKKKQQLNKLNTIHKTLQRQYNKKNKKSPTTAASNSTATTTIRVGLRTCLAIVIGCTSLGTWYVVLVQSIVAYVVASRQYPPVDLRVHLKLIVSHAFCHRSLASSGSRWDPVEVVVFTRIDGG